jgi:hypothetical protein
MRRVAQKARVIPELKEAVLSGKISLSQARRICGVIDSQNHEVWIEAAATLRQRELERLVSEKHPRNRVKEGFKPLDGETSEMRVVLTREEEALVEKVQNLVSQKTQAAATLQDTVHAMAQCSLLECLNPLWTSSTAGKLIQYRNKSPIGR